MEKELASFIPWLLIFSVLMACSKKPKMEPPAKTIEAQYIKIQEPKDQDETVIDFTEEAKTLETIHFDLNSVFVQETPELREAASYAQVTGQNVNIVGHACPLGEFDYNNILSVRRAAAVRAYFVDRGVDKKKITISGKGESEPLTNDPEHYAENRRAEITIGGI